MAVMRVPSLRQLLPVLLAMVAVTHAAVASATVEDTCAKATARGQHADLAPFCVSSLQAAPGSDGADARGLAKIATNLTLANYTAAVATIKDLQMRAGWSPDEWAALDTCEEQYIKALNVVHSAIHALAVMKVQDYVAEMHVVQRFTNECEHAFGTGAGKSPMHKVNQDAINLTTVATLIVTSLE